MKCELYDEEGKEYVEADGNRHALGLIPDLVKPEMRTLAEVVSLPSREQLKAIVQTPGFGFGRKHFDSSMTKDQNGWGKCASSAATYALEKARYLRKQKAIALSDDYLYSLVNGGRDSGSTLGENMRAITTRGIATRSTVGHGDIYRRKYNTAAADKEALRFRSHEAYAINSEQEMITALVNQTPVVIAIHVGRNWRKFDKDGVLIGDRGVGNHSEHCDDVMYHEGRGEFLFRKHSSHGKGYGDGGFCWITWDHVASVHSSHQKYAVPGAIDDPMGDNPFGQQWQDDEPAPTATLTVQSSSGCHWCVKWDRNDRQRVADAGVTITSGRVSDPSDRSVPQFRLQVGGESRRQVGYWPADKILQAVAEMQTAAIKQR